MVISHLSIVSKNIDYWKLHQECIVGSLCQSIDRGCRYMSHSYPLLRSSLHCLIVMTPNGGVLGGDV